MEISLEGTLGVLSRPGSVAEGAQAALERPNLTEEDAQAAQKPTLEHSGSILELFGGVQSAPRIGRGESRSTFAKIDFFFAAVTDFFSILPLPMPPRSALGLSLGCLLYTSPSPRDKRQSRMPSSA